ncbi:hypothetical protein BGZ63DRAFT_399942 [Mariannaea sp. PMI_226]|nr:hypothetical protein BGZ63DRAFT_399942 [Mariannaea sp. PMI_226]
MPLSTTANIFTCTFCFHLSQRGPHVLGRAARLACTACYTALLNLSICWVCEELIFRGDECVSFGWCFWHRSCYGCLLCGGRSLCRGVPTHELFRNEERKREGGSASGGREVLEAPLCAACVVEMEMDGVREENMLVQRGLRRMDKVDGGLTRARWEAKRGAAHAHARRPLKVTTKLIVLESHAGTDNDNYQPDSRECPIKGGDGAGSELSDTITEHQAPDAPFETIIWVDIFDPINNPSFKPAPLKPIPMFMQQGSAPTLGGQHRRSAVDVDSQPSSTLQDRVSTICATDSISQATAELAARSIVPCHVKQNTSSSQYLSPQTASPRRPMSPNYGPLSQSSSKEWVDDVGPLPLEPKRQPFAVIREEPLKRPSSRLAPRAMRGAEITFPHRMSPEYTRLFSQLPYQRPLSVARAVSPLPSQLHSQSQRLTGSTPPQSSEYLERYRPVMAQVSRKTPSMMEPKPSPAYISLPENPDTLELRETAGSHGRERADNEIRDWGKVRTVGTELRRFFMGW